MRHRAGLDIIKKKKIFCSYHVHAIPSPKYHPRTGHEHLALVTLHHAKKPCIHCTGSWVGPMASLDPCRKSSAHTRIEAPDNTALATPFTHNMKSYSGRSGLSPQESAHKMDISGYLCSLATLILGKNPGTP
jgi:hypothetical protein